MHLSPQILLALGALLAVHHRHGAEAKKSQEAIPNRDPDQDLKPGDEIKMVQSSVALDTLIPFNGSIGNSSRVFHEDQDENDRGGRNLASKTIIGGGWIVIDNPYLARGKGGNLKGSSKSTEDDILAHIQEVSVKFRSGEPDSDDESSHDDANTVFGWDDRFDVDENAYPNNVIGMLATSSGHCTAELVGSATVALTNSHCFSNTYEWWSKTRFLPGYQAASNGYWTSRGVGRVTRVIYHTYYDYAILKIEPVTYAWPWGGWLGFRWWDSDSIFSSPRTVSQIAYSGDHAGSYYGSDWTAQWGKYPSRAMRSYCLIRQLDPWASGVVLHDCDSKAGSSGSALIDLDYYVVAVHHSQYCGDSACSTWTQSFNPYFANRATPTRYFQSSIYSAMYN